MTTSPHGQHVIGLDVGGTLMKAAITDISGATVHTERRETPRSSGPDAVIDAIVEFASDLVIGARDRETPAGAVGIAVPGIVDESDGIAVYSSNIGWRDIPLRARVHERTGLPTALSHDVRTGGVAEARLGAGRDHREFLFLPIGTGIAGAIVLNGRSLSGRYGAAGEVGHLVVRPGGEPCNCGAFGCLETVSAGWGIVHRYREKAGSDLSVADIVSRVDTDEHARTVWDDAISGLADALAAITILLDPGLVVLGGGVAEAGDALFKPLAGEVASRLTFHTPPTLVRAQLGDAAGSLGAALLGADLITGSPA